MAVTSIEGPHTAGASAGGTVTIGGDDYTQVASTQTDRLKENATGTAAGTVTADNYCIFMKDFFNDNQIPAGATINGIEVVAGTDFDGGGNSYLASSGGSFGATCKIRAYLYNGTSFSSALAHKIDVSGITGITSTDSGASLSIDGASRYYANNSAGDDVLYGGTADLSGLSWDAGDQDEWGFAIGLTDETGTMTFVWSRGIGLRCTYTTGFGKVACGISTASTISGIDVPTSVIGIASS